MTTHKLSIDDSSVPDCCGARVWHNFRFDSEFQGFADKIFEGETRTDCAKKALEEAISDNVGYTIQWWFVKNHKYNGELNDEYEEQELMDVVLKHPTAQIIAEYSNPNSGNYICGIIIDNETDPTKYINNTDNDNDY